MYSIGTISARTGVKVPTIRYYEEIGLMPAAGRSSGNQRRYDGRGLDRLHFISHARGLGLSLEAIRHLLELSDKGRDCADAHQIAARHLSDIRARIARLQKLEAELERLSHSCDHAPGAPCGLIEALGDHGQCLGDH
ncbi:DNA-binding transcriptional regulator, MerR family [Pseudooceanicola antarcticus]|uniref:Transcriptional regulator n=1 Tax=Pseudooceanicola antarcticus TaxID=1247613 RepID=A0A285HQR3_9RHOB|nr:helix-turn-helix domain-containing protein [Pseudooceanicola antarcticus]PJE27780.1 transcriptional regulator [Pseudooceanicola antarcticus]SNY37136.1 DNA-binding transcriptional regulator, MerR family [Pseudooceanicola antarcticus]